MALVMLVAGLVLGFGVGRAAFLDAEMRRAMRRDRELIEWLKQANRERGECRRH